MRGGGIGGEESCVRGTHTNSEVNLVVPHRVLLIPNDRSLPILASK